MSTDIRSRRLEAAAGTDATAAVLQIRDRLLILPIIGVIDPQRARQAHRAALARDPCQPGQGGSRRHHGRALSRCHGANHLVQTVDASRLMGANVIVTGLSSESAQTLVTIGVDLGKINAVGALQGGIEKAERLLGYTTVAMPEPESGEGKA